MCKTIYYCLQLNNESMKLIEDSYLFVLSSSDDYYYVLTSTKSVQIGKKSGIYINISNYEFIQSNFIYI